MNNFPASWKYLPLSKVFPKIVVGYVGNVNDHYCSPEEGIPFYRTLNIRNGYFRHDNLKYVTKEFNKKNKKSQIENNDILIARVGANLGMVCKATGLTGKANMANSIIIKTNSADNADVDFFTYFLLSPMGKNQIYSGAAGGAQGVFNTKLAQEIKVPFPPLSEQTKIAKILSTWDKAISTTEALIDNSEQQKKALMQQLLTGKKRFAGFNNEWDTVKLGDICKRITKGTTPSTNGFNFDSSGINFIKVESISKSGIFNLSKFAFINKKCHEAFERSQLKNGDILFSIAGALGRTALVTDKILPANTNQALSIIRLNAKKSHIKFVIYYLNSQKIKISINQLTAQAAQPNLSLKNVGSFIIQLPLLEEQKEIASVLTNADKETDLLKQKLTALNQEKKALMQQLLTGKRRVKVDGAVTA